VIKLMTILGLIAIFALHCVVGVSLYRFPTRLGPLWQVLLFGCLPFAIAFWCYLAVLYFSPAFFHGLREKLVCVIAIAFALTIASSFGWFIIAINKFGT
jgi:hypothetical protein